MWQTIIDHAGTLLTLIGAAAAFIGMWTKMSIELNVIEKDVVDMRNELRCGLERIDTRTKGDLAECNTVHMLCQRATLSHHENASIHYQPDRWQDVMSRLTRIETLLMHIKDNGK